MKRDIDQLAQKAYDLLVVGGGIHGAALAREAALRGLTVAVVDRQDFCAATSANSLKIIHGGVRYLQQLDISRLRESVCEQRALRQIAPHLVHPLPCAMPTQGHLLKGREGMFFGLLAYDCLSWDRNRDLPPDQALARGRIGSRAEWLRLAPDLDDPRYTGVALWQDAYAHNTERLGLGFIEAAVQAGADAANYVQVTGFQRRGRDVTGVSAVDRMTGRTLAVKATLTVINTGPWTRETLGQLGKDVAIPRFRLALAMNLVLRRQLISQYAVGLTAPRVDATTGRLFFFVPWRDRTMVGTYMRLHEGNPDRLLVTAADVNAFIADLNRAYPAAGLQPDDIAMIHAGLLPAKDRAVAPGEDPELLNRFLIIDHAKTDEVKGLQTVVGVKYTTARGVAQKMLDGVGGKLGQRVSAPQKTAHPLPGGNVPDRLRLIDAIVQAGWSRPDARRLACHYGAEYRTLVRYGVDEPRLRMPISPTAEVSGAEIVRAVRAEMALTLADVVLRRTGLGSAGLPDDTTLRNIALLMARELGWGGARMEQEIDEIKALPHWQAVKAGDR